MSRSILLIAFALVFYPAFCQITSPKSIIPKPEIVGPETICLVASDMVTYSVNRIEPYEIVWEKDDTSQLLSLFYPENFPNSTSINFNTGINFPRQGNIRVYYKDPGTNETGPKDTLLITGIRPVENKLKAFIPGTGCSGDVLKLYATIDDQYAKPYLDRFIYHWTITNATFVSDPLSDTVWIKLNNLIGTAQINVYAEVSSGNYTCGRSNPDVNASIVINAGVNVPPDDLIEKGDPVMNETKNSLFLICPTCVGNSNLIDSVKWFYDSSGIIKVFNYGKFGDVNKGEYGPGNAFCVFPTRNKQNKYQLQLVGKKQEGTNDRCRQTIVFTFPKSVAVKELSAKIYPNPSNGNFEINIEDDFCGTGSIRINDLVGNEKYFVQFDKPTRDFKYPIARGDLLKGIYLVEIRLSNGERLMQKIMVY